MRKISKQRNDFDTVGDYLRFLRKEKGLKQAQLEREIGLTPKIVSKWENNRHEISTEFRTILSDFFNVPKENFANFEEKEIENLENEVYQIARWLKSGKGDEPSGDESVRALEFAEVLIRFAKESLKKKGD